MICRSLRMVVYPTASLRAARNASCTSRTVLGPRCHRTLRMASSALVGRVMGSKYERLRTCQYEALRSQLDRKSANATFLADDAIFLAYNGGGREYVKRNEHPAQPSGTRDHGRDLSFRPCDRRRGARSADGSTELFGGARAASRARGQRASAS